MYATHLRDFPIQVLFYVLALWSVFFQLLGIDVPNFESVWLLLLFLLPFLSIKRSFNLRHFLFVFILFVVVVIKYLVPVFFVHQDFISRALIMDLKWLIYLLFAIGWVNLIGYPSERTLYKSGLFFAILYIIHSVCCWTLHGNFVRPYIFGEANYDGLLMLIPFCFIREVKPRWIDYVVFFIATLCTGSRTGLVTFFTLLLTMSIYVRPKLLILLIPVSVGLVFWTFMQRNFTSIDAIDRYVFFAQAFIFFQYSDWDTIIFGVFPGVSLDMPILDSFEWYIEKFEGKNNIIGIFPFYFHSSYIRLAMTWGLPLVLIIIVGSCRLFFRTKYLPLKLLIILALLQSISLSTLTLTNVSVLFFLALLMALRSHKIMLV